MLSKGYIFGLLILSNCILSSVQEIQHPVSLTVEKNGENEINIDFGNEAVHVIAASHETITPTYQHTQTPVGDRYDFDWGSLTVESDRSISRGYWHFKYDGDPEISILVNIPFENWQWYGGPMRRQQTLTIQNTNMTKRAYITSPEDSASIVERYWVNSGGDYLYIYPEAPVFIDYNENKMNHLNLLNKVISPYNRTSSTLEYVTAKFSNARVAHLDAVSRGFVGKPTIGPYFLETISHPFWSTRVQLGENYNEEQLKSFAQQIESHGFLSSYLIIDDGWETCLGSLKPDQSRFPNFSTVLSMLDNNFPRRDRAVLTVHPFINQDCEPWYSQALTNKYFVSDADGNTTIEWNGKTAGMIDFTNYDAWTWWQNNVQDSKPPLLKLKCDGGEIGFFQGLPQLHGDLNESPQNYVKSYIERCKSLGGVEVRTGFSTNGHKGFHLGNRQRPSISITTTIAMNLAGYSYVVPDMIGGNGTPSKELFIRWVQVTTFLPVMQFSYAPWNFDEETISITKKYTSLHSDCAAPRIEAAMQAAAELGTPVNGPMWWIAPEDNNTFTIADQFLLGEDLIVAPILEAGATSRDIYLPEGLWLAENDPTRLHVGPIWLENFPAPLDTLPYFVRSTSETGAANIATVSAFLTIAAVVNALI